MPEGVLGHAGEHLEHEPITHDGKVIAAPAGHGVVIKTVPSEAEVETLLREDTGESGHWVGELLKKIIRRKQILSLKS